MSESIRVLCSGNIAVDYYTDQSAQSLSDTFQRRVLNEDIGNLFLGGKGMNFANAFSQCGVGISFHGSVGNDLFGSWAKAEAEKRGIEVDFIVQSTLPTMSFAVDQGSKDTIPAPVYKEHASLHLPTNSLSTEVLSGFDCVVTHATSAWDDLEELCAKLRDIETFMVFNPAPNFNLKSLVPLKTADLIIANKIEAIKILSMIGEEQDAQTLNELSLAQAIGTVLDKQVIVTLGENGVIAYDNGTNWHCPVRPSKIVDTVGAGDSFLGFTVSSLLKGYPIERALEIGQTAAGITCESKGASSSQLSYEMVISRPEEHPLARVITLNSYTAPNLSG